MKKLSFKEYYEAKEKLLQASKSLPRVISEYVVKKYCKLPILSENDKDYISLKPKDIVRILWEFHDIKSLPLAKTIYINDVKHTPSWNNEKLKSWVDSMTIEKAG